MTHGTKLDRYKWNEVQHRSGIPSGSTYGNIYIDDLTRKLYIKTVGTSWAELEVGDLWDRVSGQLKPASATDGVLVTGSSKSQISSSNASVDAVKISGTHNSSALWFANNGDAAFIKIGAAGGTNPLHLYSSHSDILIETAAGACNTDIILNSVDAVTIDAAGLIKINSSAAAILIGNDNIAQNITVGHTSAARDITLQNDKATIGITGNDGDINLTTDGGASGDIVISSTSASTGNINISTNGSGQGNILISAGQGTCGSSDLTLMTNGAATEVLTLTNTQGTAANAIDITATAGSVDIDAPAGSVTIDVLTDLSLDSLGTGNFNTAGNLVITTLSTLDINGAIIDLDASGAVTADGAIITLTATGGTLGIISSSGAVDVDALSGFTVDVSAGAISLDSTWNNAAAINITTNGGTAEVIAITNTQGTAVDAININASAGGITIDSAANLSLTGGIAYGTTTVSIATHTFSAADTYLFVSYTATGIVTITIPSAEIAKVGRIFSIIDTGENSSVNNITINTQGSETISGESNAILDIDGSSYKLISDGSNLWVI